MNLSPPVARALWFTTNYPLLALLLIVVMVIVFLITLLPPSLTLSHYFASEDTCSRGAYLVRPPCHFFCISQNAYPARVQHYAIY